jgi:hypothetical protein
MALCREAFRLIRAAAERLRAAFERPAAGAEPQPEAAEAVEPRRPAAVKSNHFAPPLYRQELAVFVQWLGRVEYMMVVVMS